MAPVEHARVCKDLGRELDALPAHAGQQYLPIHFPVSLREAIPRLE
jgi:hypothetical protein